MTNDYSKMSKHQLECEMFAIAIDMFGLDKDSSEYKRLYKKAEMLSGFLKKAAA